MAPALTSIAPTSGPAAGLNSVTLTGTGFVNVFAVRFGTTAAAFTVQSSNQIIATAPAGSGTVQVTVISFPGGTSNGLPYTYIPVPSLSGISPDRGPTTGGTTVTLTGTGLTGATAVTFGATPATSFTVVSDTQITATAPPGSGAVQVTVTTAGGVSNGVSYAYLLIPVITSVDPTAGPAAGGNTVTLTGAGFVNVTAVRFGTTAAAFDVDSSNQITVIAPPGSGTVQVTVTTIFGVSNSVSYTYVVAPVLTALDPIVGPEAGGNAVVLTGTGLAGATAVMFGATPATSFTVVSDTQIIAIAPAGTGVQQVTVTTVGGVSNGLPYTYAVVPSISAVEPDEGPIGGGTSVVLTGNGFTGATAVSFGGTPATSFTVVSDTQITATAPAGTGTVPVTVTTPGGTSNGVPFTYVPVPVLIDLDPSSGPETGGTVVTLTGTGFTGASAVSFGATPATSFTVVSDTQITATAPAGTGVEQVTVTTVGGVSNGVPFTYVAAPVVVDLDPASGPETGGTVVILTGTGFTGASAVSFGGTPATSFIVVSDTQIIATAPAGTGVEQVTVTTVGGVSNGVPFTYVAAPVLIDLDPASGPETGGTVVTLTGSGFTGAIAVDFGATPATSFIAVSDTQIIATAPAGTGVELVTVTTVGGVSNGVPFTYVAAPVLIDLDPASGPETGGTVVTLTGTGFTGAIAVDFGATPATSFTVVSDTQITATAPAGTGVQLVTVTTVGGASNGVPFTYVAAPVLIDLDPASGPETGGTLVSIIGTGFTGASAVSFGGTPATSFTVVSDTQIIATAPAGTGVELVTVTTVGGTSNGDPFTYVPAPVLTALDPSSGPETGGTLVTLTGTGFTGVTEVSFGGTSATSFTALSDTQIIATAPAGTGTVQVTVTTVGGTSNGEPFTYVAAPVLIDLDPSSGPETGGTVVTLTGSGFTGATAVDFGATPATSFTVVSDTEITATAPAGTGVELVTVTTVGGVSNGVPFTYVAAPVVADLDPTAGPETGGTPVSITGTGFTGASAVSFGATPAASFVVVSDTQITAVAPAGTGVESVTVTTVGGTSNGVSYTYVAVPSISGISPEEGPATGGTVVTVNGSGFTGASAVSFGGTPATSFTVVSDTQITATAPAGIGVQSVTVTTVGGTSNGAPFTYVVAPVVADLDPASGPETGGTPVSITGTGFTGASAVSFGATPAASFTVVSDTQITAVAPAGTGVESVTVTTVGGTSNGEPFTYVAAPVVADLDPTAGPETGGTPVSITGTGFTGASAVSFGATPAASFTVVSDTQITAVAPAGTGVESVTVTTVGGTSNGEPFTYVAAPVVAGLDPASGPETGGTPVSITGTGFTGASAVSFGATPATSFTVVSDTQITATAPAGTGVEQVTVTTVGGTSAGVPFAYVAAPVVAALDPISGPETGGTVVTLTGTGFTGASAVSFGGTPATSFTVVSDTQITAVAPAGTGVESVTVTTVGGTSAGVPFTYVAAPVVASLDPTAGPETGGTPVSITGTGFTGASAVSFGATPATSFTVVSDSQITAVAPAGTGVELVTVTTVGGVSNGEPFTYVAAPVVAALDPVAGPETGGTVVTLTGTGFTGASAVSFGATPAASFTVVSDTQITAVAPAGTGVELVTVTTVGGVSNGEPFTYVAAPVVAALDPVAGPETGGTVVTLTGTGFTGASAVSFGATPAASFTVVSDTQITAVAPAGTGVELVTVTTVGGTSNGSPFAYVAAPVVASLDPTAGPETGGTPVTLTGTGLAGAAAVSFGATPATSFTVVSDTQITAVAPAGTGVQPVTVTTIGGTSSGVSYTYVAVPSISDISPAEGPTAGGTPVSITGTGFTGASAVSFGATPATSFTVVSDSQITATAPAGTGVELVTVTTVGGVSNGEPFTYVAAPVVAALDPVAGPETGGTVVTLTGTGFTGASAVSFGATPATSFTVVSDTQITATAPAGTGVELVTVTTVGGVSNGEPFTYVAAPVVAALDPVTGPETGGTVVTITGVGFAGATAVSFGATPATTFTVVSDTQITATAPAGTGVELVTVTTVGGTSVGVPFAYVAAPVVAALDPTEGPETGGTTVTITGTGFTGATAVDFDATPATSFTVLSDTEITAIAPAGAGVAQVTVTTVGGVSNGSPFAYVAAPVVAALDPAAGPETGGTTVTLTGTGFTGASAVSFGATPATSFTVVSDTQTTAIAPAGAGVAQVTVTTVGGVSTGEPFTYVAAPVVAALDPAAGPETGGTTVTLTGTGFTGASAVSFGATPATSFTVVSDTEITAVAPAGTGIEQVTVTTIGGVSNGSPFAYVATPVLGSLAPTAGTEAGGTPVTLTGTGFTGASAVSFGATPAILFTVVSDTEITAVAPAGTGIEQVTVTTVGGVSNGSPFTYVAVPVVDSLDPTAGAAAGGTTVTLTGTGFTGTSAVSFGATPATSFTVVSDTQITAVAPAGTGVESVTVTTVGGISNGEPFTYVVAPLLAALDPTAGPEAGGTTVTLTGTGFTGASAVSFGATPATSFTVVSDTEITAVAPAGTGIELVEVTTAGGASNGLPYVYIALPTIGTLSPIAGSTIGGDAVTIIGTGLSTTQSVTFDGVIAPFTVVSDLQITATTPAGVEGPADVGVTTTGGSTTAVGAFTYVAVPEI